jgi:hypothetical protein
MFFIEYFILNRKLITTFNEIKLKSHEKKQHSKKKRLTPSLLPVLNCLFTLRTTTARSRREKTTHGRALLERNGWPKMVN